MAVADRVALIPLVYGRSMAFVKPWVHGWWEFGKSSSSFADLARRPVVAARLNALNLDQHHPRRPAVAFVEPERQAPEQVPARR